MFPFSGRGGGVAVHFFSTQTEAIQYERTKPLTEVTQKTIFCFKHAALSLLPVIGWLRIYRIKEWLLPDVVSGVSTGLVAVLQGMAYGLLASLPPWYGLFSAFFPVVIYFFMGTSRHISVGPFPVLCLMIGSVVTRLIPDEGPPVNITGLEGLSVDDQRVLVASSVTFLVGIMQLGMGLLQVGFVVMYLSDTLVSGFTTAAAIHILVSQLKFVLGLQVSGFSGPLSLIYTLEVIFNKITSTNVCDLVIALIIMAMVFIVKELNDKFKSKLPVPIPIEAIMTVIACGVSYGFDFENNINLIGKNAVDYIFCRYESPVAPNLQIFQETAMEAFPMAIVGFAVAFSVAKVYSVKHDYTIDGNQELIAFGVSNMFGATFKSFAASTALSRSAVQESTGGKTQVAGLISAIIVMIVTLAIGFLLAPLPKSVLGAVVIVNLKGMLMQFRDIPYLWRRDKPDCVVWLCTCTASILLGLDLGLAVGLGVELISVVLRMGFLNTTCGSIGDSEDQDNMEELDQPIDFKDLPAQIDWNRDLPANIFVPKVEVHSLILDFAAVSFLDISALKGLKTMLKELIRIDIEVYIVACDPYILEKLHDCCFFDEEVQPSMFFLTLHDAMLNILDKHSDLKIREKDVCDPVFQLLFL
uniref:Solute carrier family 26 member 3, tandem duplicate 2 n=1 Tax=Oryzias sinensis TaxID=183150 RepID=A0A8C8A6Q9_9TELE